MAGYLRVPYGKDDVDNLYIRSEAGPGDLGLLITRRQELQNIRLFLKMGGIIGGQGLTYTRYMI